MAEAHARIAGGAIAPSPAVAAPLAQHQQARRVADEGRRQDGFACARESAGSSSTPTGRFSGGRNAARMSRRRTVADHRRLSCFLFFLTKITTLACDSFLAADGVAISNCARVSALVGLLFLGETCYCHFFWGGGRASRLRVHRRCSSTVFEELPILMYEYGQPVCIWSVRMESTMPLSVRAGHGRLRFRI